MQGCEAPAQSLESEDTMSSIVMFAQYVTCAFWSVILKKHVPARIGLICCHQWVQEGSKPLCPYPDWELGLYHIHYHTTYHDIIWYPQTSYDLPGPKHMSSGGLLHVCQHFPSTSRAATVKPSKGLPVFFLLCYTVLSPQGFSPLSRHGSPH